MRLGRPMRPMRLIGLMGPMRLMGLGLMGLLSLGLMGLMGLGLVSCSDDSGTGADYVTVEAQSCSTSFVELGEGSESRDYALGTRTWTPPSGYYLYSNLSELFVNQEDMTNKSIAVFFTKDTESQKGTFFYKPNVIADTPHWRLSNTDNVDIASGTYQVYGYIPKEAADDASIAPLTGETDYRNGAVLTIKGLSTVTSNDVCVIVGAKDGSGDDNDTGSSDEIHIAPGKFDVTFNSESTNYIFLLFDHLYSALRFRFTVDANYNKLRTIVLKKLELMICDGNGDPVKAKYDATITLQKNETSTTPIVGDIIYSPASVSADDAYTSFFEGEITLSTVQSSYIGRFKTGVSTYFKLRTTYDVYDKNVTTDHPEGNLIRKGCQAENMIDLRKKFLINGTEHGKCFSYSVKVQPTYLYMLSEPDLDNPTVKIEN